MNLTEKTNRQSNIELLRIFSMIMIILHHIAVHSKFSFVPEINAFNHLFILFIQMGGKIGVNLFILISGYFLINSEFKKKKIISLVEVVLFYSISIGIIFLALGKIAFSKENILIYFFPIIHKTWWFMTGYVMLYLLSPFINKMLHSLSKEEHKKLVMILIILFSVLPTFIITSKTTPSDLGWFITLYVLGAYIRLYGLPIYKWSTKKCILVTIVLIATNCLIMLLAKILKQKGITILDAPRDYYNMNKLLTLLISLGTFICFSKIKLKNNDKINQIASTTLAVYLIHDHPIIRNLLWIRLFKNSSLVDSPMLPIIIILECIAVFGVCYIIDTARQFVFRKCKKMFVKE